MTSGWQTAGAIFSQPRCLFYKIIPFRDACRLCSCYPIVFDGTLTIANHLQQMTADRGETILPGKAAVGIKPSKQLKAFRRAVYHGGGNCMIECHNWAGRDSLEQFVERKDLRPVLSSARVASS